MGIIIEKIFNEPDTEYSSSESKWWNGHAYLPLVNHIWKIPYLWSTITIRYENRQSEFSKPSFIDNGAYGDRHIFNITCDINDITTFPNFEITERGLTFRIFKKNSEQPFNVNCKDDELSAMLSRNDGLKEIYKIVDQSPEFAPLIEGKSKDEGYRVSINFNIQQLNETALISIIKFCKDLTEFKKNTVANND